MVGVKRICLFVFISVVVTLGGCRSAKMSVADEQMERGEYFDAAATYRKIYNNLKKPSERTLRGEVAYKLGIAHSKLNQNARAAGAFRNALRYGYPDSLLYRHIAKALHADGRYAEAAEAYRQYLMMSPDDEVAKIGLRGVTLAEEMRRNPTRYKVSNAKLFNSRRSDFAPALLGDKIYLTTTNEKAIGSARSEVTGMKRADIWEVSKDEQGKWQRPEPVKGELSTEADEGIVSFSPDGRIMYLTRAKRRTDADTKVEIVTSSRIDASWSAARNFDLIEDTVHNYGHPSVDPSGQYIYFTSDRPGTYGGCDIWRMRLDAKSGAVPENLGPAVNTTGREMFPYAYSDSIIYFSSDGLPGMGGLDIFKAVLTPSGVWKVTNMGVPVNSAADDFGITFYPGREAGFFSSARGDARGYDHIYSFELPDLKISISGMVTDFEEEPIAGARIRIVGRDGSNRRAVSRDDGTFSFDLERGVSYIMQAGAKGYLNARQEFVTDTAEQDAEYEVNFMLASLTVPNVVENIFYDYNKATLRPESTVALDSLAQILRDNPSITVEMSSHTDRVGSDAYNNRLSESRAKSVVDYLISAGIQPERLKWKGYGKSHPKKVTKRVARLYPQFKEGQILNEEFVNSLSEEERDVADQINRRTEFKVTSTDFDSQL
ncbi:MAG: OmpA family protein [Paramuribaculum sp.]|nr:OmpA family protein [Paramuribaculum sp.]